MGYAASSPKLLFSIQLRLAMIRSYCLVAPVQAGPSHPRSPAVQDVCQPGPLHPTPATRRGHTRCLG